MATIIHDRSGRPDVYPWRLLRGPVLEINLLPRRRKQLLHRRPDWPGPRARERMEREGLRRRSR